MLIASPRHTARDLEVWRTNEAIDAENARRLDWGKMTSAALDEMERWISSGVGGYLGVSWGKDSVVVAHLLARLRAERGVSVPMVWVRMPEDNPDCTLVRDAFMSARPDTEYVEIDPGVTREWLASRRDDAVREQHQAGFALARQRYGDRHISGVRAEESSVRRLRTRRWGLSTESACAPIAWWSTAEVFAYLHHYGLPVHPAYACTGGGLYERNRLRVAGMGGQRGIGVGRRDWEQRYYPEVYRRLRLGEWAAR